YRTILRQIYSPRYYYQRVVTFLREFKTPGIEVPMDLQRFLAIFRSCLRLGIIGRERVQYWKLMAWTLLMRPRLFPLAMALAIQGYHFRKVSELHLLDAPGKRAG
ncbi:MAG: B12-binding radical protein, partial [Deltaproteobacteria bacterium]|nr:B12-binding radical protein [Deltaproteobacteria bacterium]